MNLPLVKKKHGIALKRSTAFGPMTLENGMKKLESAQVILLSTEKFVCLVMSSLIIMMFQ
jgi:hypothetical protein